MRLQPCAWRRLLVHALALALVACTPKPDEAIKSDVAQPTVTSSTTTTTQAASAQDTRPDRPRLRVVAAEADTDALSTIRTARLRAKSEGRVLVVYVSATWCSPCKRMKSEIEAGNLDARLGKTTLLAFDADKDGDRLGAAGYTFKFVPFVALPGPDGHPADSQQATGEGSNAWKELLGKLDTWQSTVPH